MPIPGCSSEPSPLRQGELEPLAEFCRQLLEAATQRYFALDHETFTRIAQMLRIDSLEETDTRAMA